MAVLAEYLGSVDDTLNFGTSARVAMGFKVPAGATIEGWGIVGSRGVPSTAGTFRVSIYETISGNPDSGTLIKSEDYDRTVLPVYTTSPTLQSFTLTSPTGPLTGGTTQYYMMITNLTGSASDNLRWSWDTTSPTYPDGNSWAFFSGSWNSYASIDSNFQITGTEASGGFTKPNYLGFSRL